MIMSFSDCGLPVNRFSLSNQFNVAAGLVLLFEVGRTASPWGAKARTLQSLSRTHLERGGVRNIMRSRPNLVPAGHRSPAGEAVLSLSCYAAAAVSSRRQR